MFTQENRLIAIDTPLGQDELLLVGLSGAEGLSRLFSFELNFLSENHGIVFNNIIGENVSVSILLADGDYRFFNGIVSRFSQGSGGGETGGDPRFSHYTATMVPWLWLLTKTSDSRIFQELSVPDIIEQIFTEKGFTDYEILLDGTYQPKNYCVQYRETDFDFISRLMEDEGIFYFFKHEQSKHTLVLADVPDKHQLHSNQETARYQISAGGIEEEDVITGLEWGQEIQAGKYTLNDYNFEIPGTSLKVDAPSKITLGPGEREIYDYPGYYGKRAAGERLANIRMQEHEANITAVTGSSVCRVFTSGYRFTLRDYYRDDMNNKDYVLISLNHRATQAAGNSGSSSLEPGSYANNFACIPFDVPYRPLRETPKPLMHGSQTAIVVGPAGEEIYTDEYGRVKIQFHWDREGENDENSSCWIRVSQVSAGAGWGAIDIPRIGHEIIVDFLEGDPDQPIITGRVYHGINAPPVRLPAGGMISGSKSNTTPGGGGYNEMTMDDTKGKEKIAIHAQYDMSTEVEHDQSITIKSGNRTLEVKTGTNTGKIKGDDKLTVEAGTRTVSVTGGNHETTVNGGNYSATASGAVMLTGKGSGVSITGNTKGVSVTGTGKGVTVVGKGTGVKITGEPNFEATGISLAKITGPDVDIGNAQIKIHGNKIDLGAGGSIIIDKSGIKINSSAPVEITGGPIKLNC